MIKVEVSAHELLSCHAGTTIKIPATISGRPVPKVKWEFDGTAPTEKKNEHHTLPVDSDVSHCSLIMLSGSKCYYSCYKVLY